MTSASSVQSELRQTLSVSVAPARVVSIVDCGIFRTSPSTIVQAPLPCRVSVSLSMKFGQTGIFDVASASEAVPPTSSMPVASSKAASGRSPLLADSRMLTTGTPEPGTASNEANRIPYDVYWLKLMRFGPPTSFSLPKVRAGPLP